MCNVVVDRSMCGHQLRKEKLPSGVVFIGSCGGIHNVVVSQCDPGQDGHTTNPFECDKSWTDTIIIHYDLGLYFLNYLV